MTGGGPDLKARTDLAEREEKARIDRQRAKEAPERLRGEFDGGPSGHHDPDPGLVTRLWRRLRG